jgi:hypothetical protein
MGYICIVEKQNICALQPLHICTTYAYCSVCKSWLIGVTSDFNTPPSMTYGMLYTCSIKKDLTIVYNNYIDEK